ncbi:MAG: 1-acyl-sn-glycerol-3-phosphate acyltransferase [Ilumatobacteraceae bacterium]
MTKLLARLWLRLWRWTTIPPDHPLPDRCVVIAAPHTTNWDFPITLAMAKVLGIRISWLGKDALFRGPMGPIMRWLGGVAIDRSAPGGMVASLADELNGREQLKLVVPAEGTRSRTEYWKSGFYRIAQAADVPIVLAFVDKSTRSGGFGPAITVTGDVKADMDLIRAFYEGKTGLKDNRFGPIRLKDEDAPDPA